MIFNSWQLLNHTLVETLVTLVQRTLLFGLCLMMVICLLKMFILYINVDGSYISTMAKAVCGGPVRDYEGRMIKGIYTNLGTCHSLWVELWGMSYSI